MYRRSGKKKAVLRGGKLSEADIPLEMDLLWAVANLIQCEEHLWSIIGDIRREMKDRRLERRACALLDEVRDLRAHLMKKLVPARRYELWCELKHSISQLYRIGEVASKLVSEGKWDDAVEMLACQKKALEIYVKSLLLSAEVEKKVGRGGKHEGFRRF